MEQNDPTENENRAPAELSPGSARVQGNKQATSAKTAKKKPDAKKRPDDKKKKWSLKKHWDRATPIKRIEWVAGGLIGFVALIYYASAIWGSIWNSIQSERHFRAEHRPRLVLSRPVQLLEPATYNTSNGIFSTGRARIWFKNTATVSDATAKKAFANIYFRPIPVIPGGASLSDSPPEVGEDTCKQALDIPAEFSHVPPSSERYDEMADTAGHTNNLKAGSLFRLYAVACVHYSQESGEGHATCDRLQLTKPNATAGTDDLFQVDQPILGEFVQTIIGHCAT